MSNLPIAELKVGLKGRYKLTAHKVDEDGNIISSRTACDWFDNLITNAGLDAIGKVTTYVKILGCVVGTGNTTPAFTDTQLASYLAGTSTQQVAWAATNQVTTNPYYVSYTTTYRFATGAAAGNLTEVGIGGQSAVIGNTSILFSRALITDPNTGLPTTITILSDEILDVTYELRLYLPNGGNDVTGSFNQTIDGVSTAFTYTIRAANINLNTPNGFNQWWNPASIWSTVAACSGNVASSYGTYGVSASPLGAITTQPAGQTGANSFAGGILGYTSGNYYTDYNYSLTLANGNISFISYAMVGINFVSYQMQISPAITKINTKTYVITMRFSWGRF